MSGNAAKEISDMLSSSIQKVEHIVDETKTKVERLINDGKTKVEKGTEIAKKCSEILEEVVKNVHDTSLMVNEISVATNEQSQGINEITKAMNQLDEANHQNASNSSKSAESAMTLSKQANDLLGVVENLGKLVNGKSYKVDVEKKSVSEDLEHSKVVSIQKKKEEIKIDFSKNNAVEDLLGLARHTMKVLKKLKNGIKKIKLKLKKMIRILILTRKLLEVNQ